MGPPRGERSCSGIDSGSWRSLYSNSCISASSSPDSTPGTKIHPRMSKRYFCSCVGATTGVPSEVALRELRVINVECRPKVLINNKRFGVIRDLCHFLNYSLLGCPPLRFGQVFGEIAVFPGNCERFKESVTHIPDPYDYSVTCPSYAALARLRASSETLSVFATSSSVCDMDMNQICPSGKYKPPSKVAS